MEIRSAAMENSFIKSTLNQQVDLLIDELTSLKRRLREESIHDTRVQSRRLRTALECFKDLFPPQPWKALYNPVREITKTLGKARETEVILNLVKELTSSGDMAENLCREYVEEKFQKRLSKHRRRIKKNLRSIDTRRLRARAETLLSGLEPLAAYRRQSARASTGSPLQNRPGRVRRRTPQPALFRLEENPTERGRRVLGELAVPILSFRARYDFRRATDQQLHELRISAKKLRYALEVFDQAWPTGLKQEIASARALQDAGGHYHDWCVLRDQLQDEIRRLTKQKTTHLAFQMGRLLAQAEDARAKLRTSILPPLTQLQAEVRSLLRESEEAQPSDSTPWQQTVEG